MKNECGTGEKFSSRDKKARKLNLRGVIGVQTLLMEMQEVVPRIIISSNARTCAMTVLTPEGACIGCI
jgi:hypothetical protein